MRAQARYRRFGAHGRVLAGVFLAALAVVSAHASVAVLLEQPYGKLGMFSPSGHSAIYLDHVCAATPVELRPCRPGELGVVISRYDGIDGKDWVAMPLMAYLYAVDTAAEIPLTMDKPGEMALRDKFRRAHLEMLAPDRADGTAPEGNWYELTGAAYDRTIYGFSVRSTAEQDAKLIAQFNDSRNVETYNGFWNNCADFTRMTVNEFYPHAVRRNFIADWGMTSPKSVAGGLVHYSKKHPEAGLTVFVVPQVAGTLPRSHSATNLAEGILKRYSIPLTLLSPEATGLVFVAYVAHGRFAMPKDAVVLDLRATPSTEGGIAAAEVAAAKPAEPASAGAAAGLRAASMVAVPAGAPK